MKTFWEIYEHLEKIRDYDDPLWKKNKATIKNFTIDFYEKNKESYNLLSCDDIQKKIAKASFFRQCFWKNTLDFKNIQRDMIFATEFGICFCENWVYFFSNNGKSQLMLRYGDLSKTLSFKNNNIESLNKFAHLTIIKSPPVDISLLKTFISELDKMASNYDLSVQHENKLEIEKLTKRKSNIRAEFDKDENGIIDLIENDFSILLNKNQKTIIDIDRNYVHKFVKVSNYINTKKENIQEIFESIKQTSSESELDERFHLLKNQIHTYELLLFHSINMIIALVDDDLITFYEIYESLDKLGIYNSNWENEVSDKLSNIGDKLSDLLSAIDEMEYKIIKQIGQLTYVTQESFKHLNHSVSNQLKEINSSIHVNSLLSTIQSYQLFKINKNLKS